MQDTLAKMNTWMVYLVLLVITLFAAYFMIALGSFFGKMKASVKKGGKKKSSMGCLTLLVVLVGFVLVFVVFRFVVLYTPYTGESMVARVNSYKPDQPIADFKLVVGFYEKGEQLHAETYFIKGNRWQVKGEWVQWRSPFTFVGLKKSFRLTHIQGQYINIKAGSASRANSYTLVHDDKNALWRSLVSFCKTVGLVKIQEIASDAVAPNFRDTAVVWISEQTFKIRVGEEKATLSAPGEKKRTLAQEASPGTAKSSKREYPRSEEQIRR
jgi:hypothetical protein